MFNTPILFLIFNRPDTTKKVFEIIRQIQPKYLYVAADGPRENIHGEVEICQETRNVVLKHIDWDCKLVTRLNNNNLGCGKNVSGAISWFFENVEQGIILEDDCVPSLSFFNFCENLLDKYKGQENIYMISGSNFQNKVYGNASYFFSEYGHVWGWATWRRAWNKYAYSVKVFNENAIKKSLAAHFKKQLEFEYWYSIYVKMKKELIDTWDYQWHIAIWINNGISITPNKNLVTNIGFNNNGTHTLCEIQGVSNKKSESIEIIKHPIKIKIQREADKYLFYKTNLLRYNPPKKKITLKGFLSKLKNIFITNLKQLKIK